MRRIVLALVLAAQASAASAGPLSDELGKCMVARMTGADRDLLVRWLVVALAGHPAAEGAVFVDPAAADPVHVAMGQLMQRLLLEDCPGPARAAVQAEGHLAIGAAFALVGEVAGREASVHPQVVGSMQAFYGSVDQGRLQRELFD